MSAKIVLHQERAARILLVEDNPGDVVLMKHMLEKAKISNVIDVVKSGEEGLSILKRLQPFNTHPLPDLILLDLNLPGISGHEVLEILKSHDETRHIPIIILSSSQTEAEQIKSSQLGANGYLIKPMNIENFNKMLIALEPFRFTIMVMPE